MNFITYVFFRTISTTVAISITVGLTVLAISIIAGVKFLAPSITDVVVVVIVLSLLIGIICDIPNVCVFNTISG